jgi:hypothetical protein
LREAGSSHTSINPSSTNHQKRIDTAAARWLSTKNWVKIWLPMRLTMRWRPWSSSNRECTRSGAAEDLHPTHVGTRKLPKK